jgi:hypothetical protein
MADHMKTTPISDAITVATNNTERAADCILHSDRGTQGAFKLSSVRGR